MTDQASQNRGMHFVIGFGLAVVVGGLSVAWAIPLESPAPVLIAALGLAAGGVVMLMIERPYIGYGIFAVLAAVPVLLVGSCFVLWGIAS